MSKKNVIIYIKGIAMTSRRGLSAWSSSLNYGDKQKIISGTSENSTASEMECNSILYSVRALVMPCNITVKTNLEYIANFVNNKNPNNSSYSGWGAIFNEIELKRHTLNAVFVPLKASGADGQEFLKLKTIAHREMELARKSALGYSFDLFDAEPTY